MTTIIIGAGLAGLACARRLADAGHAVRLIDKGRGCGGRLATRRTTQCGFDTGAQFFSVRHPRFAQAVADWESAGLVRKWCDGFPQNASNDGIDGHPRYEGIGGMNPWAKCLARGLDLTDQLTVQKIELTANGWNIHAAPGDLAKAGSVATGPAQIISASAVVMTAPVPQAVKLLDHSALPVDPLWRHVSYDPCLALLAELPAAEHAVLLAPGALRCDHHPVLRWVASQRQRGRCTQGDGLLIHAQGAFSTAWYQRHDEDVRAELWSAVRALPGMAAVLPTHVEGQVKRWRYSLATTPCATPFGRVAAAHPLLLAGDGFGDCPRIEGAWLSGVAAAEALIAS